MQTADPALVSEWQRRRDAYLRASRLIRKLLAAISVLLVVALFLPWGSALAKLGAWLLAFGVLLVVDSVNVRGMLLCPSCGNVPFLLGGQLVGTSNPRRCSHCGKALREPGA